MRAKEFVDRCIEIATRYQTIYMWGTIGSPVTHNMIEAKAKQYPDWYNSSKKAKFESLVGKGYWGFDCVGLIKTVLWGWKGNSSTSYGGAVYKSNGVPDVSANGMISLCKNVSTNFKVDIPIGAALWRDGHIGVYIGNGLGVESTPIWQDGVQITAVANIGSKSGYNSRTWTKWGLIPWVNYEEDKSDAEEDDDMTFEKFKEYWATFRKELQDNDASSYSKEARDWAVRTGLVQGGGAGEFNGMWEDFLTREQMVTLLYRFANMLGKK